jgi:acyl carrier protein
MTPETVRLAVFASLAAQLETTAAEIDPDTPLIELPGMESVLLLRAIVMIEEELGVTIPDDIFYEASTPRQLADIVLEL